ncbi:MAG TPA: amino acid adenylation domain-containing protein [Ktedonobacteraceae bacterium]|nr:amino acid adenylation domain-containing protein [Ktedonobacteraceae bacterium]
MQQELIEGFKLSPRQKHLWPLSHRYPCYAQATLLLQGHLNTETLYKALQGIVERHEILRTTFRQLPGMRFPVQVVSVDTLFSYYEIDLSDLGFIEQERRLTAFIEEEKNVPFDFEHGSLFRCALIKQSISQHILLMNLPSLCADASTLNNLMTDISQLYHFAGQDQQPSEEPLQYTQASEWMNELLEEEEAELARDYWLKQISRELLALHLPLQQLPSLHLPTRGQLATLPISLPLDLPARLPAAISSVALFLQACWHALLARLTQQAESLVGVAFDGRKFDELLHALGPYATSLPVRVQTEPDVTFSTLLQRVSEAVEQASAWQEYFSWEQLSSTLGLESDQVFLPICFAFEVWPLSAQGDQVRFSLLERSCSAERSNLKLSCLQIGPQISAQLSYHPEIFPTAVAARLAENLATLIGDALEHPDARLRDLEVVGPLERQYLLTELNDTAVAFPAEQSIHRLFEQQVRATPDQVAVTCQEHQLSYGEINRRANQLCRRLQNSGVRPGACVGILLERSADLLIALFGVLKAGGAYVPLDPINPQARVAEQMEVGCLAALLTQEALLERVEAFGGRVLCLDGDRSQLSGEVSTDPEQESSPELVAYMIATSGSTGRPKGVAVTHRNLVNYTRALVRYVGLSGRRSFANVSTLAADLGHTVIFPALLSGGCLHLVSYEVATDGAAFACYMEEHGIDILKIVPSHLRALLASQVDRQAQRALLPQEYLICGGEALPADLLRQVQELGGDCQVLNHYGPTEATVGALAYRVEDGVREQQLATVPIGRPLANTEVYVLDEWMRLVPVGGAGELYIGGEGVSLGYLNEPEQTARQFMPNPYGRRAGSRLYKTGDRVRWLGNGTLAFLGRVDRQVKLRGYRIELGEIEAVLRGHPGVRDAVVVHSETADLSRLVAYIVTQYGLSQRESQVHRLPNTMSVFHLNKNETEHLYREIFHNRVHLQHGIRLRDGDCILDVGANIGFFTLFAHQQCHKPRIYAFEPNPEAFEMLRLNMERYGLDAHLFNFGLSNEPKMATFRFYPRASVMSGFYADTTEEQNLFKSVIRNQLQIEEKEQIFRDGRGEVVDNLLDGRFEQKRFLCELKTLSDVIQEHRIDRIDLLKLDVEKSELDVLNGIRSEDWLKIRQIVVEVHDIEGRVALITTLFKEHGFVVAVEQTAVLRGTDIYKMYAVRQEREEEDFKATKETDIALPVVKDVLFSALDVRRYMRERLPEQMVPAAYIPLATLPLTPNGKVNYRMLPAPALTPSTLGGDVVAPRTPVEEVLAAIWKQLLGIEHVSVYDNFFEIGGDSILSLQIVALARQKGLGLTTKQIFEQQNIAGLATVADASSSLWSEQGPVIGQVPLTPIQHWFFKRQIPNRHHWNMALFLEAKTKLRPAFLDRALGYLLAHHDALRMRFFAGETGYQQVNGSVEHTVPFVQIDLSHLSAEEQEDALEILLAEFNTSLNLADGPLLRVVCMDTGASAANQLFLLIHHLIVDAFSLRIFVEDLQTLYRQLEQGEAMQLPPKTTSLRYWTRQLAEYAQSAALQQELPYWTEMIPPGIPRLPMDTPPDGEINTEESIRTVSVALAPEATRMLLQEVPRAYHTQINDALLTALAQAVASWTGQPFLLVDLESHGREDIFEGVDLSRTVGWFTAQFPLLLKTGDSHTPGDRLKAVKEQLRAIPNHGIGYGLLRYLNGGGNESQQLQSFPQPDIRFNYLGQFDQTLSNSALFALIDRPCGPLYCLQGERQHLLDITGSVVGGQLKVDFDYSERVYVRDTIERLAKDFLEALGELISWCQSREKPEYTPSDFPEAGLSQGELDSFLNSWTQE